MCGIVGVVSRPATRPAPGRAEVLALLDAAIASVGDPVAATEAAAARGRALLRGVPGVLALTDDRELVAADRRPSRQLDAMRSTKLDVSLESGHHDPNELEAVERPSDRGCATCCGRLRHDRLRTAHEVSALAGRDAGVGAVSAYLAIQQSLSAIDRLEVRGRDSAGIHVFVHDHGLDLDDPAVTTVDRDRVNVDPTFQSGSVRVSRRGALVRVQGGRRDR